MLKALSALAGAPTHLCPLQVAVASGGERPLTARAPGKEVRSFENELNFWSFEN